MRMLEIGIHVINFNDSLSNQQQFLVLYSQTQCQHIFADTTVCCMELNHTECKEWRDCGNK